MAKRPRPRPGFSFAELLGRLDKSLRFLFAPHDPRSETDYDKDSEDNEGGDADDEDGDGDNMQKQSGGQES